VLRTALETETQDWFELDEGDPGFQLLTEGKIAAVILFLLIFVSTTASVV
jgi:hypothetical protein